MQINPQHVYYLYNIVVIMIWKIYHRVVEGYRDWIWTKFTKITPEVGQFDQKR